jgi:hypothetical protein
MFRTGIRYPDILQYPGPGAAAAPARSRKLAA